ncbi:MAG: hypothetical protein CMO43_00620 [Verrucomicrobiales bacterium]|nr:hypothetical protein [Verrucomicrobiales bacterium]
MHCKSALLKKPVLLKKKLPRKLPLLLKNRLPRRAVGLRQAKVRDGEATSHRQVVRQRVERAVLMVRRRGLPWR